MLILATKLHRPPPGPQVTSRFRLLEKLQAGLEAGCQLTVVSAAAGSGKTTLVSDWMERCARPVAWLSLDAGDNQVVRFLTHLIAAVQVRHPDFAAPLMHALQAPQLPSFQALMTSLVNAFAGLAQPLMLVLDDVHLLEDPQMDQVLVFLVEHLPVNLHLVLVSREDPMLPLPRLRARGKMNEIRISDLRFTLQETGEFLNGGMNLSLVAEEIAALEQRTEGWIAGLQLAALSLKGQSDLQGRRMALQGSHRFVLDYLVEEVLQQQPPELQDFLLQTSVLDRMCGPLCAAVTGMNSLQAQQTLEHLERSNLFLVPLDHERRWYRYHHLFGELLRQRLQHASLDGSQVKLSHLHLRASQWYEDQKLGTDAFQHACAAGDLDRAERLVLGGIIPLHFRSAVDLVLDWMAALPVHVLHSKPMLCAMYASFLLVRGQTSGVEEKIEVAEQALQHVPEGPFRQNMLGQLCAMRSTLNLTRYRLDEVMVHSGKALDLLDPENLAFRSAALWGKACALLELGDLDLAEQTFEQGLILSRSVQDTFSMILSLSGLGRVQELQHRHREAADTYGQVLLLSGEPPLPNAAEAHIGLARMRLEQHDLTGARLHAEQGLHLAKQYDQKIDRFLLAEMVLVLLDLAGQHLTAAEARLIRVTGMARQGFLHRLPELEALRVKLLLKQGNQDEARVLAEGLPDVPGQILVALAQIDASRALKLLAPLIAQVQVKGWKLEELRLTCLQVAALHLKGDSQAEKMTLGLLVRALTEGSIRMFLDAGPPMRSLLQRMEAKLPVDLQKHVQKVLSAYGDVLQKSAVSSPEDPLLEPLSRREIQILQLVSEGLSNQEIGARLFLALDTVKGHNRNIYGKLQVRSRTEAIRRARELGLLI